MKRFFLLLFVAFGLRQLALKATDGFMLSHIHGEISEGPNSSLPNHLFAQKYTYLARGSQSYAFVSEDGQYVLKFFRHSRWRLPLIFRHTPLFPKKRARRKESKKATLASCHYAMESLREETSLIGLHLNKSKDLGSVTLIDRNHIAHNVALDSLAFVVQRCATPVDKKLLSLKEAGDIEGAKRCIDKLLSHITHRFSLGISDKDPHPIRNFGFIEETPIEVDIGGFVRDPNKGETYFYTREIEKVRKKMDTWLKNHFPEISAYANMAIDEVIRDKKRSSLGSTEPGSPIIPRKL